MRVVRHPLLCFLGFAAAWAVPAAIPAQQASPKQIEGKIDQYGIARIKIALPAAAAGPAANDEAAALTETLRSDLDSTGLFDIVDPERYRLVGAGSGAARRAEWLSIGADTLVEARLRVNAGRIDLEARLQDNTNGNLLFEKRYGGEVDLVRRVAHKLADDVVQRLTGRKGISLTRIAFVSTHGAGKEIYLMDYDGRRVRRLTTTNTLNLSPDWSPGGDELAFVSWRGRQPGVYLMSAEGELRALSTVGGELSSAPDWSPDGRQLAYSSDVDGNTEIYVLVRATGRNRRLTHHPAIDTAPAFSPNGREIAFTSDRSGTPQIYIMDVEGVNVRRVSTTGNYNDSAAWSPSGDRLAYASRIDGRFQIVVLDLAKGTLVQLSKGPANHENPSWSPDGRHLVCASDASGSYQIHTLRDDGSDERQLTRGPASFTPDWSN